MAAKKEPKDTANHIDYKDSSLHNDFQEIKVLLGCILKDIDKITEIEKLRAGM